MKSIIAVLFLLQTIHIVVNIFAAEQALYSDIFRCKTDSGTFQTNSPYKTNLQSALKRLTDGYNSAYVGKKPNEVTASALCAGYLQPKDCASCLNSTIPLLQQKCPNQKGAVAWRNRCMVRYGAPVVNNYDLWFVDHEVSQLKAQDVQGLQTVLSYLIERLARELYSGEKGPKGYAFGILSYGSAHQTVYMVIQCTHDTIPRNCNDCVYHIFGERKRCCSGSVAATMLTPNCFMRYAHADFRIL